MKGWDIVLFDKKILLKRKVGVQIISLIIIILKQECRILARLDYAKRYDEWREINTILYVFKWTF